MNNLFVEADKIIESGFILYESDVRRLLQLSSEQIKKTGNENPYQTFKIKYENGAVATTGEIDEIFNEDNFGSTQIIMLEMVISKEEIIMEPGIEIKKDNSFIRIVFNNISSENNGDHRSMRYKISGTSRDWIMVTSSLIEERLIKFKRKSFSNLHRPFLLVMMFISMIFLLLSTPSELSKNKISRESITNIENDYKSGKSTNVIDIVLAIEKAKLENGFSNMTRYTIYALLIIFFLFIITQFRLLKFNRIYPIYNFCWGDYLQEFKRIEKRRKFLIGLLVITILLGIGINLASNLIWGKISSK